MKDPYTEDFKPKNSGLGLGPDLTPQRADTELSNESKKRRWGLNKKKFDTPSSGTNAIESAETSHDHKSKKPKQDDLGSKKKDICKITCYNYDRKGHYARNCPEPNKDISED